MESVLDLVSTDMRIGFLAGVFVACVANAVWLHLRAKRAKRRIRRMRRIMSAP